MDKRLQDPVNKKKNQIVSRKSMDKRLQDPVNKKKTRSPVVRAWTNGCKIRKKLSRVSQDIVVTNQRKKLNLKCSIKRLENPDKKKSNQIASLKRLQDPVNKKKNQIVSRKSMDKRLQDPVNKKKNQIASRKSMVKRLQDPVNKKKNLIASRKSMDKRVQDPIDYQHCTSYYLLVTSFHNQGPIEEFVYMQWSMKKEQQSILIPSRLHTSAFLNWDFYGSLGDQAILIQTLEPTSKPTDPRDFGSDVRCQPNGQRPFPSATATSTQKRSAVVPRHEDGKRGCA
ncbi:hypothetical protein ACI65C_005055 [Semiaphis heraclei]